MGEASVALASSYSHPASPYGLRGAGECACGWRWGSWKWWGGFPLGDLCVSWLASLVKTPEKSIWMRDVRGDAPYDIEDLAHGPSGGRGKQWLAGVVMAALPVIYGVYSIQRGYTTMFDNKEAPMTGSR